MEIIHRLFIWPQVSKLFLKVSKLFLKVGNFLRRLAVYPSRDVTPLTLQLQPVQESRCSDPVRSRLHSIPGLKHAESSLRAARPPTHARCTRSHLSLGERGSDDPCWELLRMRRMVKAPLQELLQRARALHADTRMVGAEPPRAAHKPCVTSQADRWRHRGVTDLVWPQTSSLKTTKSNLFTHFFLYWFLKQTNPYFPVWKLVKLKLKYFLSEQKQK